MVQKMSEEQMRQIYEEQMKRDFPPNELKPLSKMQRLVRAGVYEGFLLWEGGQPKAYWMLLRDCRRQTALLDYLGVLPEFRGQGYGSRALLEIRRSLPPEVKLLIEAEDPAMAEGREEREVRERRLAFYRNNHAVDTGLRACVFEAPYVIFVMGAAQETARTLDREWLRECYQAFYREYLLSEGQYTEQVQMEGK